MLPAFRGSDTCTLSLDGTLTLPAGTGLQPGDVLRASIDAATGHVILLPPAAAEAFEREIRSEALDLTAEQRARVRTYWQWAGDVEVTPDGTIDLEPVVADAAGLGRQVRVVGRGAHLTIERLDGNQAAS